MVFKKVYILDYRWNYEVTKNMVWICLKKLNVTNKELKLIDAQTLRATFEIESDFFRENVNENFYLREVFFIFNILMDFIIISL